MKLAVPTLGPILGYTSGRQARIWIRGEFHRTPDGGYRRCFGVARIRKGDNKEGWGVPRFVKLEPHFDVTGVFVFAGLEESTVYTYQAAWFFSETELTNLTVELPADWPLDWTQIEEIPFRTGTESPLAKRAYAVGSCRYLLRLFGGTIFDDRGDKAFESIREQILAKRPLDGLVMVGDQIYADDLNVVGADTSIDDYLERYRAVFSQEHVRRLMTHLPTYMILDDHEIEDNWPVKASDRDWVTRYPAAIHAYQIYQCSHSPLFQVDSKTLRITGTPDRFWYSFQDGCCDWFVMDCRTERVWSDDPARRKMVTKTQRDALLAWLSDGGKRVKIVVTSVPFFPDLTSDSDDKWGGYVVDRTEILDHILKKEVRRVVFLSGDVHCSFTVELRHKKDPKFKIVSLISSSFFWPYPHMDEGDFALKGSLATANADKGYVVTNASTIYSNDNFARLEVDPKGVTVSFYERKGKELGKPVRHTF